VIRPCAHRLVVLALFALFARPVAAQEVVRGQGFAVSIPAGFSRMPTEECAIGALRALKTVGAASVRGKPEVHCFYAGSRRRPDSVLVVGRIELADGHEINGVEELIPHVRRSLHLTSSEFDELLQSGALRAERVPVGRIEAYQTWIPADGPGEPTTRTLAVPADRFLVVLVLVDMDEMASGADAIWRYTIGSLRVEGSSALLESSLRYGGVALGLLLLLVVFLRFSAARRERRASPASPFPLRAIDGLPERDTPSVAARSWAARADRGLPPAAPATSPALRAAPRESAPLARPAAAGASGGSGRLIATLPPSGRWAG
jgi:hypothetical protein